MKVNAADFANLSLLSLPPRLRSRLENAELLPTDDVPPEVVTMQSRVVVVDLASGRRREIAIVYPGEADPACGRISVLDELGGALFGASIGDTIECGPPHPGRLRVEAILYQPERWMRLNLSVRE